MVNKKDFQKAVELIAKSNNILLTTHTRPDGDACGSMTAMADALTAIGKKVKMLMLSQVPEWYEFLFSEKVPVLDEDVSIEQLENGQFDLIVILDTNSYSQLPKFDDFLKANDQPVLAIDHHVTSDNLGEVELVDATAAATGLIVLDFLKCAKWTVTSKIAEALFVAVATDTGWFRFTNTDSRTLQNCAELIELGANPSRVYNNLYQSFSAQRFKLMTVMLNSLELHLDGRYAAQHLQQVAPQPVSEAIQQPEFAQGVFGQAAGVQGLDKLEACGGVAQQDQGGPAQQLGTLLRLSGLAQSPAVVTHQAA